MKLTLIGGGGFRVPQIVAELSARHDQIPVAEVCLYDVSDTRLEIMGRVIREMDIAGPIRIVTTSNLERAVTGSDFIFSAIRVGGSHARVIDEQVALRRGILGQETVGPGGYAYAFRTIPAARHLAETVLRLAPEAWVLNFTNPAGIITQAMREVMGERVVGICDTPIGLVRRAARALQLDEADLTYDYVGLNHLGWLRSLTVGGVDRLPELLADDQKLHEIEEARIIGFDWVRQLGMLPNEYLFYYYKNREAVDLLAGETQTRGEYLDQQQSEFYAEAGAGGPAGQLWEEAHAQREATYMVEAREIAGEGDRHEEDLQGGGYQKVAVDLMAALSADIPARMILGVANQSGPADPLVPGLSPASVVEVPTLVDGTGIHPQQIQPLVGSELGLVQQVKACEEMVIRAATTGNPGLGWQAIASHPLVNSVTVAKEMFDEYCSLIPEVGAVFAP